ncbi:hypothetical protein D5086_003841 [Populus alba]|uniref:Uncharacterized protein n=1 Tax=Populus alba TaxID=43335 RepID=A0ACC4D5K1_POPAL
MEIGKRDGEGFSRVLVSGRVGSLVKSRQKVFGKMLKKHLKDVKAQLIIDKALCGGTVCPWLVDSSFILHVSSTLFSLIVTPLLIIGKVWLRLKDLLLVEGGGSPRRQLDPPCRREDSPAHHPDELLVLQEGLHFVDAAALQFIGQNMIEPSVVKKISELRILLLHSLVVVIDFVFHNLWW